MSIVINTNVPSLTAQSALSNSGLELDQALERLSTGLRINSAADDAAGLAIANRLEAQIGGLDVAVQNANDGISLAQTAEGALQESTDLLLRMRNLAIQSINDSNSNSDRSDIQLEVAQLQSELNRVSNTTSFGSTNLLDGSFVNKNIQVGAFADQTISFSIANSSGNVLGNNAYTSTGTMENAVLGNGATNNTAAQNITVSGNSGSATVVVSAAQSANSIATAVNNNSNTTGVTATASTTATISNLSGNGQVDFSLTGSNANAVNITASVTTGDLTELMNAINNVSAQTGITASAGNNGNASLVLTSTAGYDINLDNYTNTAAANATVQVAGGGGAAVTLTSGTANNGATVGGSVVFSSTNTFTLTTTAANTVLAAASETSALSSVSSIDLSTGQGATNAIAVIDAALTQIDDSRANLGAIENRLGFTISNLGDISNNEAAAESRIRDADFAQETANLTRAQILQQAGTSILSQANSVPQMALKLLQ